MENGVEWFSQIIKAVIIALLLVGIFFLYVFWSRRNKEETIREQIQQNIKNYISKALIFITFFLAFDIFFLLFQSARTDLSAFVGNIAASVAGNMILYIGGGLIWFVIYRLNQKNELIKFFGLNHSPEIKVYLSNLWFLYMKGTSKANLNYKRCDVISNHEFKVVESITNTFGKEQYVVKNWIDAVLNFLLIGIKFINVKFNVSPNLPNYNPELVRVQLKNCTVICIGSTLKNTIRRFYYDMAIARIPGEKKTYDVEKKFVEEKVEPTEDEELTFYNIFQDDTNKDFVIITESDDCEGNLKKAENFYRGIIQKKYLIKSKCTLFMCAGERGDNSWLITEFLMKNWKVIYKAIGTEDFVICLGFKKRDLYADNYIKPHLLYTNQPKLDQILRDSKYTEPV